MNDEQLLKYFNNACPEDERREVEAWLQADHSNAEYYLTLARSRYSASEPAYDKEKVKARLLDEVQYAMYSNSTSSIDAGKSIVDQNVQWMKVAAVVLVIILGGIGGYMLSGSTALGDKQIVYKEHTVPAGEIDSLTLSDGTKVKLNAGTTLKYPERFGKGNRTVYLAGEAYFNVAHNKAKPFQVRTEEITTTVLGTAFNVTAYRADRQVRVAVAEGKVRISKNGSQANSSQDLTLTPSQSIQYDKRSRKLTKQEVKISNYISWKDGILVIDDKTLPETARILERWYGVKINLNSSELAGCIIHGRYQGEQLANVLKTISFATGINYEFTKQGIVITGGRCK